AWIGERLALLEEIKQRNAAALEALPKPPITVTLPDGKAIEGKAWETSPLDIASGISKGLASATCVASARRLTWASPRGGLVRPLEGDCELRLHKWDEPAGKETFWRPLSPADRAACGREARGLRRGWRCDRRHSSAHVLGEARAGPERRRGRRGLARAWPGRPARCQRPRKPRYLSQPPPPSPPGPFVDLCRGPHLPNTGKVKAFAVTKTSAALWLGKAGNDELQRVYGVSFPDKKEFAEWKALQEEAKKRDHRAIGIKQELFFFDDLSPGSCFFQPLGGRLYNKLVELIRGQLWLRGYEEVITPNMYNLKLWQTSGHATKYAENMFMLDCEGQPFALKAMNCPGHCLMFKHRKRSYRELPLRMADFGVLHRNELSGEPPPPRPALAQGRVPVTCALTGLTRVRRFQQDDAHIFCMVSQIKQEIANVLDMISTIYGWLGMDFALNLSTKPESALGDAAVWETAEGMIAEALDEYQAKSGRGWSLNPGDGAFYGPKIDIHVYDALKRPFQCATVQLDFVQPQRFDLKYMTSGAAAAAAEAPKDGEEESAAGALPPGYERPVMIHRAVLGSVERMIAILTEHFAGKWPFFLSPRQAVVVPVSAAFNEYAEEVRNQLHAAGFYCDVDASNRTLNKMVREAQLSQYNFILVVGKEEAAEAAVNVRTRDNEVHGKKTVEALLADFKQLLADHK
ncbi:threonine-tRNA ligase, partial [Emiliania huxleyi CCMP1516]|uniref:threonine--tRNA ligase n=2 Tax=Emiliania huxleyi TaxID=2903 RepID=A0A0D3JDM1_EMIH1